VHRWFPLAYGGLIAAAATLDLMSDRKRHRRYAKGDPGNVMKNCAQ
jgi:hypothetical protein